MAGFGATEFSPYSQWWGNNAMEQGVQTNPVPENAAEVKNVLKECMDKLDSVRKVEGQAEGSEQTLEEIKQLLEEKFRQSDDFLHKENVKVYRNVQAALIEELNKQTEELKNSQVQNKASKALLPLSVLILIGVVADIVINLLPWITTLF